MFFELLGTCLAKFDMILHYFILMDNHYHRILEMGEVPLHKGLQALNQNYSRYFNNGYNRCGTAYDGRHSGKRIVSDSHYFQLLRYQAYNPVLTGIVKYPGEYRWSAHREILDGKDNLLKGLRVLDKFSKDHITALKRYREFIESDKPDIKKFCKDEKVPKYIHPPKEHLQYIFDEMELSEFEKQQFFGKYQGKTVSTMRKEYVQKAVLAGHPLKDIAGFVRVSYETVRRYVNRPTVPDTKSTHSKTLAKIMLFDSNNDDFIPKRMRATKSTSFEEYFVRRVLRSKSTSFSRIQ